jgi:hypothetical protein
MPKIYTSINVLSLVSPPDKEKNRCSETVEKLGEHERCGYHRRQSQKDGTMGGKMNISKLEI